MRALAALVVVQAFADGRALVLDARAAGLGVAGVLVLGAGPAAAAPLEITAAVCPEAPPGMQAFADDVIAWAKWGVLALLVLLLALALLALTSTLVAARYVTRGGPF